MPFYSRLIGGNCLLVLSVALSVRAQTNIITNRFDNNRTASTTQESILNTSNVNSGQFGYLYNYAVSGSIYAQPLYVAGLKFPNGTVHNTLLVATMNDRVYAFDADTNSVALWARDFTNASAGVTAIPITDIVGSNNLNIVGNVGIEGTPALDLTTNTMYLVARTEESGSFVARLHAIDITTGLDKAGSPVVIQGSVAGTASDAVQGVLSFNPKMEQQRGGLALVNGYLIIPWGSHEDIEPYHGWLMTYAATTLQQVGVFCTTPNGMQGGIWQSGRAPVVDSAGNVYYMTGNGDWDGINEFSDSVLKFSVGAKGLTLLDWFTSYDQAYESANDLDLGSSGLTLLPGTQVLVGGGKSGILYSFNAQNLGHQTSTDSTPFQKTSESAGIFNGPAYWNGSQGPLVFIWVGTDVLRSYAFSSSTSTMSPLATGSISSPGSPAGVLSLSSKGTTAGTGIVWAELPTSQANYHGLAAGVLRAFDAVSLQELWDSEMVPSRDRLGTLVKFNSPLIVNGRVYAATSDGLLRVYGLLSSFSNPNFSVAATPSSQSASPGSSVSYSVNVAPSDGFTGTVALSVSGLPGSSSASFTPASISGGSGTSTLQISTTSATPPGVYTITVTGVSGSTVNNTTTQLIVPSLAPATSISIDFVGTGTAMAASEVAGVVPQSNWNDATGATNQTGLTLVDQKGANSGALVTWQSDNGWSTSITDTAGNARMMRGYLDNGSGDPTVVNVSNLPQSSTGYDVYVYLDGANGTATHTGLYQISGPGIATTSISATDSASTDFSGTFTQANNGPGNYVKFSVSATAFVITATPGNASDGVARAPINGIQIVPSASSAPGFSLSLGSASQTVAQGATATYPYTVTAKNGFTGTVSLSASGAPTGATTTLNPKFVTGSGTGTLSIATSASSPAGTYTITVSGVSGSVTQTATTQLVISGTGPATAIGIDFVGPDTAMAASETAGVIPIANWNDATGAANSTGLALLDQKGQGTGAKVTWQADSTYQTLISDTPGNYRMMKGYLDDGGGNPTVVTVSNLPASSSGYDVYIYSDGANGSATRTANYQISGVGITTSSATITDSANADFSGSFTQASNGPGNYAKFTINATGFTITATPGAASDGTFRAPMNGIEIVPSSGSTASFSVSTGGAQTVVAGASASYPITVTGTNGFSGAVNLTLGGLPSGANATFTPASVTGSGSSTLQVSTSGATPSGSYTLTVTGTSGSLVQTAQTTLVVSSSSTAANVVSIDFVGTSTAMAASETAGVVAAANWNNANGASNSTGLSLVNQAGASSGAILTWTADDAWSTGIINTAGSYRMMKGYLDNGSTNSASLTVANLPVSSSGYDIYVYADGANGTATRTGSYTISGSGIATATISLTDAASTDFAGTFVQANNSSGNYVKFTINATTFKITATPGAASDGTPRAPVNGLQIVPSGTVTPSFTISAGAAQTVSAGSSATYAVNLAAVNGFSGTVALSVSGLPTGASATFNPTSITGQGSSSLLVATSSSTPAGSYMLTITGTSGSLVKTATTTLSVTATQSAATAISVDFVGNSTNMSAAESAGVIPKTNWNNASGASNTTGLALKDANGNATTASLSWTADGVWNTTIANTAGNNHMMMGYLDNGAQDPIVVTVSSLPASSTGYDIYVYTDGQNGSATRSGSYQISGTGITTTSVVATDAANTDFAGTFTQANNSAGDYVKFTINATSFKLTATPTTASDGTLRSPVNGLQIIPH